MDDKLGSRIVGGNSAYGRAESDFYPTPPEATVALMEFLRIPKGKLIWEPACGEGDMVEAIGQIGYNCIGTDIRSGKDFLTTDKIPCDWIITNPPFSLAEQFIKRCVEHNVNFALLLKSQYWHSKKRYPLFFSFPPKFILSLTWRPDFLFKKRGSGSPLMDVMWCVWYPSEFPIVHTRYVPLTKPEVSKYGLHSPADQRND